MGWGATVLTDSVVKDDTLGDKTQPDHTRDLTADPAEDQTTPMDKAPVEVATITRGEEGTEENAEWKDTKSDKPANLTPIHEEG